MASEKLKDLANKNIKIEYHKKWWFWVLMIAGIIAIGSLFGDSKPTTPTNNGSNEAQKANLETYTLKAGELGSNGKLVVLNKDTDMPAEKYMYKLPAGQYIVTTSDKKVTVIFIVKDTIKREENNTDYTEVIDYVGDSISLTADDDDFAGMVAKEEAVITINADESVMMPTPGKEVTFVKM